MTTEDVIITIPAQGGALRVEQPAPSGGREIFHCTPQTVGRLLTGLELAGVDTRGRWIDLLGATTPGLAVQAVGPLTTVVLTFPARRKQVQHTYANGGDGGPVTFPLPPTAWVLKFRTDSGAYTNAYLCVTGTRATSVTDPTLCRPFPFGNAHTPTGEICWGNVTTSALRLEDPLAVDHLFFGSGFNADLLHLDAFRNADGNPFHDTHRWIAALETRPDEIVIRPGTTPFRTWLREVAV